jgi:hypothetical protein
MHYVHVIAGQNLEKFLKLLNTDYMDDADLHGFFFDEFLFTCLA